MEIKFKQGNITHHGTVTTIEKDNEFQYSIDLRQRLQFTIHLSDDGYWESDNLAINPELVTLAGDTVENMEDLEDVLTLLEQLR